MFLYKIFGYNVSSELELRCNETLFQRSDITIVKDKIDINLFDESKRLDYDLIETPEGILFEIFDIAHVHIERGELITFEPLVNYDDTEFQLYLLGTVFGLLMLQRGEFCLHGSCISDHENTLIVSGDSGAGKSSFAYGITRHGYSILTDDVCRLTVEEKAVSVYPSYPSQKLWPSTLEHFQVVEGERELIKDRDGKLLVQGHHGFSEDIKRVTALIELTKDEEVSEPILTEVFGMEALEVLIKNTYRVEMFLILQVMAEHMKYMSKLLGKVRIFKLRRPEKGFTVDGQIKLVKTALRTG